MLLTNPHDLKTIQLREEIHHQCHPVAKMNKNNQVHFPDDYNPNSNGNLFNFLIVKFNNDKIILEIFVNDHMPFGTMIMEIASKMPGSGKKPLFGIKLTEK